LFNHPNIVKFYGVCVEPVAIVTELVEGRDLWEVIHDDTITYTWADIQKIAAACARGMSHIHQQGQIHRDLKSLNLLVCRVLWSR
jgi:mitogen-activated protein kinase kinase kinase 7